MAEILDLHGISFDEAQSILADIGYSPEWSSDEFLIAAQALPDERLHMLPAALRVAVAGFREMAQAARGKAAS